MGLQESQKQASSERIKNSGGVWSRPAIMSYLVYFVVGGLGLSVALFVHDVVLGFPLGHSFAWLSALLSGTCAVLIGGLWRHIHNLINNRFLQLAHSEQEARRAEERFRLALEAAQDGAWDCDITTGELIISEQAAAMLGYDPGRCRLTFSDWEEGIHPDDLPRVHQLLNQHIDQRVEFFEAEYRMRGKSGEWIWILDHGRVVKRDSEGNALRMTGTFKDITLRRKMEEALKTSEANYRAIFDSANDGIAIYDIEQRVIIDINRKMTEILGFAVEEMRGASVLSVCAGTAPYTAEKMSEYLEKAGRGRPQLFEWMLKDRDGCLVWVEINLHLAKLGGRDHLLAEIRDIRSRKQTEDELLRSQARYRGVVEDQSELICRFDLKGQLSFVNPTYCRYFNQTEAALTGASFLKFVQADEHEVVRRHLLSLDGRHPVGTVEIPVVLPNGQKRWLQWTNRAILDESDKPAEYQGVGRDITDRKLADVALKASQSRYQQLFNCVMEGIGLVDGDEIIQYCNPAFASIFDEDTPEDLIGKNIMDFVPADRRAFIRAQTAKRKKGESSRYELDIITRKGNRKVVLASVSASFENGRYVGAINGILDITERKQAEQSLKYRADFERLITSLSSDFLNIKTVDIDTGIRQALRAIGEFADVDRSYVFLYDAGHEQWSNTHEWCRGEIEPQQDNLQDIPSSAMMWWMQKLRRFENVHLPRVADMPPEAGSERRILEAQNIRSLLAVPMVCEGLLVGFVGFDSVRQEKSWDPDSIGMLKIVAEIFGNVLERKRAEDALQLSENRYQEVFNSVMEGLLVVDDTETIIFCNPTMAAILEESSADDLMGKKIIDYVVAEQRALVLSQTALRREGQSSQYELEINTARGHHRIILVSVSPRYDTGGRFLGSFGAILDITERKHAEEALRESRRTLATLMSNLPGMAYRCRNDRDWTMEVVSDGCRDLTGYEPSDLIGNSVISYNDVIHPEDRESIWSQIQTRINDNRSFQLQYRIITKDKREKWVWEQGRGIFDDNGILMSLEGFIIDITDRKLADEQLSESERRYRMLFESANDAIFLMQGERFVDCNTMTLTLFGCTRDQIIGEPPYGYSPPQQPDGRDSREKATEKITAALNGYPQMFEWVHSRLDGSLFDAEVSLNRLEIGGNYLLLAFVKDITERKRGEEALRESEEKFREIAELAPEAIFEADSDGTIRFANRKAFEYFGYDTSDLGTNLTILDMISPRDLDKARMNFARIMNGEKMSVNEYMARRKDGSTFPISIHSSPVSRRGQTVGVRGIVVDVTTSKQREQELLRTEKLESVGLLAGGIAHDFNNLLTGILGNLSMAKGDINRESETYVMLEEAERAAVRATDLTQQLLTFSKGGEPVRKAANIEVMLRDAVSFALRGSNVKPLFEIASNLRPVKVDTGQVGQVIHNLVINANQAMPDGGKIRIIADNVTISADDGLPLSEGDYVRIDISDEGIGIPKKYLERIFDPYFTTKQSGSGLGLATAYSIMKKHQGHIAVSSQVGVGTTFSIYLPGCAAAQPTVTAIVEETEVKGSGRILVMDDEDYIRNLTSKILVKCGYTVDCAKDGAEAIRLYREAMNSGERYEAVILDLTVPGGIGGQETIERLREIVPQVKAIVCSGYSKDPVMADYRKYGFSGVVAKPFTPKDLTKMVKDIVASEVVSEDK